MSPIDPLQCCYREQMAYKLYSTFREPALYRMALLGDWEKIPSRCHSHPKEASFVHKYAPNDTALHRILRTELREMSCLDESARRKLVKLKFQAVAALVETHGKVTSICDSFGRTPLHLACLYHDGADDDATISLLLASNASVVATQDVEGRTPLHLLLMRGQASPELVQNMVHACPAAVGLEDAVRETPMDVCMRQNTSMRQMATQDHETILRILEALPMEQRPRTAWRSGSLRSPSK
ncbi:hypothetical protein MPSEU_000296300 [Mayamaea pseudoterrestris]|nr:hypothetical protein MPSEU_000296300 [Mayamaea pseudoterrestris]